VVGSRVLAVDIGSSGVRSAIVDSVGTIIATTRVRRADGGDGTRFDASRLWRDVAECIRELPADRHAVDALGIAGHVGTVFVGTDDEPVDVGRGWADGSGSDLLQRTAGADLAALLRETGRVTTAGTAAAAYLDLLDSRPDVAAEVARVLTPKDFVILRMTGRHVTDRTSAGYSGLSAVASGSWSPRALELVGLDGSRLPEQHPATAIVGTVDASTASALGLTKGLPVVAGTTDGSAGAASVLGDRRDAVADIAGTTDVLLRLVDDIAAAPARAVVNPYPLGGYSVGGPTGTTGGALMRWAAIMGFGSVEQAARRLEAVTRELGPGADGLSIDPSLSGSRFPHWDPARTGMVSGHREDHSRDHFLLAAAEGAAHIVRAAVDVLDPGRSATLVLAGGAARSPALARLRADVLGRTVEVCDEPDVSLLGAALLALRGARIDDGGFSTARRRTVVAPDSDRAASYEELHERWSSALGVEFTTPTGR
jgi:xylulokinase